MKIRRALRVAASAVLMRVAKRILGPLPPVPDDDEDDIDAVAWPPVVIGERAQAMIYRPQTVREEPAPDMPLKGSIQERMQEEARRR